MLITICHRHELGPATMAAIERLSERVQDVLKQGNIIMSALDDFITAQQAFNTDIASDLTTIQGMVSGLNSQISALQTQLASAGLTPEQTAALAALTTAGQALETQADTLAGKVAAPPASPPPTSTPSA